jgi:hypothetical protein
MNRAIAVGIVFAFATSIASSAHAWCRTTTDPTPRAPGECATTGTPISWQSVCAGYSLYIDGSPEIPFDELHTVVHAAADTWQTAACDADGQVSQYFRLVPLPDTSQPTGFDRSGVNANTISFNSEWHLDTRHRLGTIAITLVSYDPITGEILDADIEMNQASDENMDGFHFATGDASTEAADLPTILTHELGHFQGLAHSDAETAVMWPTAGLGEQRRMLRTDDVQAICDAYPPEWAPTSTHSCAGNQVPYGGFASNPYGGRVRGGCTVGERRDGGTASFGWSALALAFVTARMFSARRSRRV